MLLLLSGCAGVSQRGPELQDAVDCKPDQSGRITVIGWVVAKTQHPSQQEVHDAQDYAHQLLTYCMYVKDPTTEPSRVRYERVIWEDQSRFIFAQVSGVPAKQKSRKRRWHE